jgi:tetrapyrrole methylase family protein / MazG family protein
MSIRSEPWIDDQRLMEPSEANRASFGDAFERLVGIMARLRGPGGCPWDREQTLDTLKPYIVEETYEVLEAIEEGDVAHHQEELGDLLLQVVFHAQLRQEVDEFDAADVTHGICDKLVRRHPHVFGDANAEGAEQAYEQWEIIKAKEKEKENRSVIDGVPRALPALIRAQRTTEKASRVGFDWNEVSGPLDKVTEETRELTDAIIAKDVEAMTEELGDLLFAVVNLARFLDLSAEDALNASTNKFSRRFKEIETRVKGQGDQMQDLSISALDRLWNEVKAVE